MRVMKFRRRMSCLEACNLPDHFDWGRNLPTYVGSGSRAEVLSQIRILRRLVIDRLIGRRLGGHNQLPKLVLGVKFTNGLEVVARPASRHFASAAA